MEHQVSHAQTINENFLAEQPLLQRIIYVMFVKHSSGFSWFSFSCFH